MLQFYCIDFNTFFPVYISLGQLGLLAVWLMNVAYFGRRWLPPLCGINETPAICFAIF